MNIRIGQLWRDDVGSKYVIVGFDADRFALVKRSDSPKKSLAHTRGAYTVALSEFETWTLLDDPSDPELDALREAVDRVVAFQRAVRDGGESAAMREP